MRTTKIVAFSIPPELEVQIHRHAQSEHRTISEYLREAVRQYMRIQEFSETQKKVSRKMKKRGLRPSDVEAEIEAVRKKS